MPPGGREKQTSRADAQWSCEKCNAPFRGNQATCNSCGHERCDDCLRKPTSRKASAQDEAAIRSVEERMRNLDVSPQASAA